jgi:phosphoglycolate phosphatase-like HAD superfamily hydrolase
VKYAFDIDGVIANFDEAFRSHIKEKFKVTELGDISNFKYEIEGVTDEEVWEEVKHVINKKSYRIRPYSDAIHMVRDVYKKTKRPIHFLTARPKETEHMTLRWLQHWIQVPFSLTANVGSTHKGRHLVKRGFDGLVEDRYRTAVDAAKHLKKVILFNRPWNMGRDVPDNVKRVDTYQQLLMEI